MDDLIRYDQNQSGGLQKHIEGLPVYERQILDALIMFNQLRAFKLDGIEILQWKDSIVKLLPGLQVGALEFAIERMIIGQLEYDAKLGIQNIINALKKIERIEGTENSYRIKNTRVWG